MTHIHSNSRWTAIMPVFFLALLAGCGTPTPQTTPQLVNVYVTSAAYPWVSGLYDCASNSAVINLSGPQSAEFTMRLGVPDHLTTPAFQISTEQVLVIVHPQNRGGILDSWSSKVDFSWARWWIGRRWAVTTSQFKCGPFRPMWMCRIFLVKP